MRTLYDALECSGPMTIPYLLKFFPAIGQANFRGNTLEEIRIIEKKTPRLKRRPLPVLWPESDDEEFLESVQQIESTSFLYQNDTPPTTDIEESVHTDDPDSETEPETDNNTVQDEDSDNNTEDEENAKRSTDDDNISEKNDDQENDNTEMDERDGTIVETSASEKPDYSSENDDTSSDEYNPTESDGDHSAKD